MREAGRIPPNYRRPAVSRHPQPRQPLSKRAGVTVLTGPLLAYHESISRCTAYGNRALDYDLSPGAPSSPPPDHKQEQLHLSFVLGGWGKKCVNVRWA